MSFAFRFASACLLTLVLLAAAVAARADEDTLYRIVEPRKGRLYHGAFPPDPDYGDEVILPEILDEYEQAVGRRALIVYFSHNWYRGRVFPLETAEWVRRRGAVPYIRLMLRSTDVQDRADRKYKLSRIIAGRFDPDLRAWARAARDFATPLIVEYGTECNGRWFAWNGLWNGRGSTGGYGDPGVADGPERFVDAFRRIVDLMRAEAADNITWVWHPHAGDWPQNKWNRMENYYPGDGYADWIAVSAYGPQEPTEDWGESFREQMDPCYDRLRELAPDKPIYIAEFGCHEFSVASDTDESLRADRWAEAALDDIFARRWPAVLGFTWWNESWENDDKPEHDTTMRVQDIPALAAVFKARLKANRKRLQRRPVTRRVN